MESMTSQEGNISPMNKNSQVCIVGYAFNSKKIRKSSPNTNICHQIDSHTTEGTTTALGSTNEESKQQLNQMTSNTSNKSIMNNTGWRGGGLADILYCNHDNDQIVFYPFDPSNQHHQDIGYDIIIHKLTEDILSSGLFQTYPQGISSPTSPTIVTTLPPPSPATGDKLTEINNYLINHPHTKLLDSFECVSNVLSRYKTCNLLQQICQSMGNNCPFNIPNYFYLDGLQQPNNITTLMHDKNIYFPVICKPIDACGTPTSHHLVVVSNLDGFQLVKFPCLVQQYFNHCSKLYKVYVMDDEVMIHERVSLPNLMANEYFQLKNVAFNSAKDYPTINDFIDSNHSQQQQLQSSEQQGQQQEKQQQRRQQDSMSNNITDIDHNSNDNDNNNINDKNSSNNDNNDGSEKSHALLDNYKEYMNRTAKIISKEFGLSLYGFDMIIPCQPSSLPLSPSSAAEGSTTVTAVVTKPIVIDVNYFPSYKEVGDFPQRLKRFLRFKAGKLN